MSESRAGRRKITSRAEVEHAAFELFDSRGFERTTIDDIAEAAGIGRRTFFRYFPSKNDIAWGDFDDQLRLMRKRLADYPADAPLLEVISDALVDFNRIEPAQVRQHRRRMRLILATPALQAHSALRYADWRQVLADFVGERLGVAPDSLAPQAIAYATLGVALAAYEQWLRSSEADLGDLLAAGMAELARLGESLPEQA
ncbi:mycofactocin system transcriptional regulator [Amycolatopsis taiwanensis]|uniref:Mycofactocin system transcriptional regulator n=1 Tax=Amycolatopsis taiwanensis TaxID=342230 RepID=A0A9W6R9C4_9PSEU|nr:mycofactocin system transcriptional regulator [Amycolatopsis taiwanensis]GLY71429.1 mycofactocin system transcriptional regulator [Amycolatopsis taiwanensis]